MYSYNLIRAKRRTISLCVTDDCRIEVRAPKKMPQKDIDAFVAKHDGWIAKKLELREKRVAFANTLEAPEAERALREKAKTLLPELTARYSAVMGLSPVAVGITSAKKRFGSCGRNGHINYSWRLAAYPDELIEYVVVHELAHLKYFNHGRDFYALIGSVLPDYASRRKRLKEYSGDLS